MREACSLVWSVLVLLFQSRASLEAEILILRHQLNIQRRHLPKRLTFSAMDRLIFVGLSRLAPSTLNALTIVKPETVVRWHRAGSSLYWRWIGTETNIASASLHRKTHAGFPRNS